jgi:hypothetical protein
MKYSANAEILENDDLAEVAWYAIEPLWDDMPYSNTSKLSEFMSDLTVGQQALVSIDWCQKEIRNGGIKQLMENSTGNLIPYAISGFSLIGAQAYSELLSKACKLLGMEFPISGAARKRALNSLTDEQKHELENLDDEFFELIGSSTHDIEKYRGNYVKDNPGLFIDS